VSEHQEQEDFQILANLQVVQDKEVEGLNRVVVVKGRVVVEGGRLCFVEDRVVVEGGRVWWFVSSALDMVLHLCCLLDEDYGSRPLSPFFSLQKSNMEHSNNKELFQK